MSRKSLMDRVSDAIAETTVKQGRLYDHATAIKKPPSSRKDGSAPSHETPDVPRQIAERRAAKTSQSEFI